MTLKVAHDSVTNSIWFITGEPHDETDEIENHNQHVLDYDSTTYRPTAFELVLCARVYLPLASEHGYDAETDTLTFGKGIHRAKFAVANGDLVAHWAYAQHDPAPEFYTPVAVQLKNASKNLAPAIAELLQLLEVGGE